MNQIRKILLAPKKYIYSIFMRKKQRKTQFPMKSDNRGNSQLSGTRNQIRNQVSFYLTFLRCLPKICIQRPHRSFVSLTRSRRRSMRLYFVFSKRIREISWKRETILLDWRLIPTIRTWTRTVLQDSTSRGKYTWVWWSFCLVLLKLTNEPPTSYTTNPQT